MHYRYVLNNDLVTIRTGTVPGEVLPPEFHGFDQGRLRQDGNDLVDCTDRLDWLLDDAGRLRLPSAHVGSAWLAVNCAWDTKSVLDGGDYRLETDADRTAAIAAKRLVKIKAECKFRIYATASPETQMNMATATAVVSAKTVANRSVEETAILTGTTSALAWVDAMRSNVVVLAADDALDYSDDANWPTVPADVVALVAGF